MAVGYLIANGIWNHFTGKKKYGVTCYACGHSWEEKVPFEASDKASVICPNPQCRKQNTWSHSQWEKSYNERIKNA